MGTDATSPPTECCADIDHVLVTRNQIARRVVELAAEISAEYRGRELTVMIVLTGSLPFAADLIRLLPLKIRIELVVVRSYPGSETQPRKPKFLLPPPKDLTGRDVLIVDDIFDSGQTMTILVEAAYAAGARGVKTCTLLYKDRGDLPNRNAVDYVGFNIPDEFVVGYGLDFNGFHRNLPDIGVLQAHARGGTS